MREIKVDDPATYKGFDGIVYKDCVVLKIVDEQTVLLKVPGHYPEVMLLKIEEQDEN